MNRCLKLRENIMDAFLPKKNLERLSLDLPVKLYGVENVGEALRVALQ